MLRGKSLSFSLGGGIDAPIRAEGQLGKEAGGARHGLPLNKKGIVVNPSVRKGRNRIGQRARIKVHRQKETERVSLVT